MLVEQCAWHRVGTYLAQVTEKRIIVDKLQASFVPLEAFDESWTPAEQCQLQSFAPMQNGILNTFDDWKQQDVTDWYRKARVHALNISSVELGTRFDRENAKFQYASDRWLQQFKLHLNKYAETQCQTRNNFLILIRSISRSDPSMAAKLLLHRGDVSAIREGDKLIVFPHNGIILKGAMREPTVGKLRTNSCSGQPPFKTRQYNKLKRRSIYSNHEVLAGLESKTVNVL
uniref:HTH CENPB-type domain-containing protein n=1 Tax=Ascaris lumbricoides TaxID=6252 RepID=A0A0M3IAR6_ASCLU